MRPTVDILLATYNGGKYLGELLASLLQQTYRNLHILIRDDGSKDDTVKILREYEAVSDGRIEIITDDRGNLGVTNNMFCLLTHSRAPYVMFCDQDDVWMPDKVATLLKAIRLKEKQFGSQSILVHADAVTVDENLKPVSPDAKKSLTSYQTGRDKRKNSFVQLLLCNTAQGASMIFNRKLVEELEPIMHAILPNHVIYDSITASVCSISGHVFYLARPLMYYRQHGRNLVGAKKRSIWKLPFYDATGQEEVRTAHFLSFNHKKGNILLKYYQNRMSKWQKDVIRHFDTGACDWKAFYALHLDREFTPFEQILMRTIGID
ncbi:MAG: glycosyltransferase family 2 protein [Lachnospiraceae bacterium]|nr:glycosyltransferase family 2 protein [Lachnospiraceae bacterium]